MNITRYFKNEKWIYRSTGVSLSLEPERILLAHGPHSYDTFANAVAAWDLVVEVFSRDYRWANTASMEQQYWCHFNYGSLKTPWNLEPWKTSTNPITCN